MPSSEPRAKSVSYSSRTDPSPDATRCSQPLVQAAHALEWCDLLVSVGTSGVVYPAAELPRIAIRRGIPCVEINPEETAVSRWYTHTMRGPASDMLRRLTD